MMARRSKLGTTYPPDWRDIARTVKDAVNWRCVRCDHPHDPAAGRTLTIHHLDMDPSNNRWHNLLPLCQACHLSIQARVDLDRPWLMTEHTPWIRVYLGGYFAWKYLGQDVTADEVRANLDWYADIERRHFGVIGEAA